MPSAVKDHPGASPAAVANGHPTSTSSSPSPTTTPPNKDEQPFTEAEDFIIKETVGNSVNKPFTNWISLESKLAGREAKQIQDRWVNHLNPALNFKAFSRDDDLRLDQVYQMIGAKWKEMAETYFDGTRSENQLKNRFNGSIFRNLMADKFPEEAYDEDEEEGDEKKETCDKDKKDDDDGDDSLMRFHFPVNIGNKDANKVEEEETSSNNPPLAKETVTVDNSERAEHIVVDDAPEKQSKETNEKELFVPSSPSSGKEADNKESKGTSPSQELNEEKAQTDGSKNPSKKTNEKEVAVASSLSSGKEAEKEGSNEGTSSSPPPAQELNGEKAQTEIDEENTEKKADGKNTEEKDDDKKSEMEPDTSKERGRESDSEKAEKANEAPLTKNQKMEKEEKANSNQSSKDTSSKAMAVLPNSQSNQQQLSMQQQMAVEQQMRLDLQKRLQLMTATEQMMDRTAKTANPQQQMQIMAAMNAQMLQLGHQIPPQLNPMQGMMNQMIAQQQAANHEINTVNNMGFQQQMVMGMAHPGFNSIPIVITLPPPPAKLGILLDDNKIHGVPQLMSVASNSPIRNQIPSMFRENCCIASIKSNAIGRVQPKTAKECADLISKSQKAAVANEPPPKLEIVLVQVKKKRKKSDRGESNGKDAMTATKVSMGIDNGKSKKNDVGQSGVKRSKIGNEKDNATSQSLAGKEGGRNGSKSEKEVNKDGTERKKPRYQEQSDGSLLPNKKQKKQSAAPNIKAVRTMLGKGNQQQPQMANNGNLQQQQQTASMDAMMQWRLNHLTLMQATMNSDLVNTKPLDMNKSNGTAAQQMMTEMMARSQQGFSCHPLIITLPLPHIKLGILLDDNTALSMPELKGVATNSPIRNQIAEPLQKNCFIASMMSEAIGFVRPKTAQQCAVLISKSQQAWKGNKPPPKLELVLVQINNETPAMLAKALLQQKNNNGQPPNSAMEQSSLWCAPEDPKKKKMTQEEQFEFYKQKKAAVLDFFSDESKPTYGAFCRQRGHNETIRGIIYRAVHSSQRLEVLMEKRDNAKCRTEAYEIIEHMFPDKSKEEAEFQRVKKMALLDFFSDVNKSLPGKKSDKMRGSLKTFIDSNKKLKSLVDQREKPEARAEAFSLIEKLLPDVLEKEASKKDQFDRELKTALITFFNDSDGTSLALFCAELGFAQTTEDKFRVAMSRFIDKDKRLRLLVDNRGIAGRRREASNIIEKLMPMTYTKYSNPENMEEQPKSEDKLPETHNYIKSKSMMHEEFFNPENIKHIAENLDFDVRPRMTRDGSKEITLHDRKVPDELVILLTFDLSNRVIMGRAVSHRERNATLSNSAKILFYDHGYKKVGGVSTLDRTWVKRLENAYVTGADNAPLDRLYKGKDSYTDTVESQHPGLLTKLYNYTEEMLGKDCSTREKAMFMNEKSMEDADEDPLCPVLNLEQHHLMKWIIQQKLDSSSTKEVYNQEKKKSDENELSIAQIETKHPGLIEEFYNFAVEALGPDATNHMLAVCMNERAKEYAEENPTMPLVTMSKVTLPGWLKKRGV